MLKHNTESVGIMFLEKGYELLDEYRGCIIPMRFRCKCGQFGMLSLNKFQRGDKCGKCSPCRQKFTREEVASVFLKHRCELLEQHYKNNSTLMSYRCKCGNISKVSLAAFKSQNQNCYQCGLVKIKLSHSKNKNWINKISGPNNYQWIVDREQKHKNHMLRKASYNRREDVVFRRKMYKALSSSLKLCGLVKSKRTHELLGYTPEMLQSHIYAHPNYASLKKSTWHLDHIFPITAFVENGIFDLKIINSLDNLQPLSCSQNTSKHAKYDKAAFAAWLASHGVQSSRVSGTTLL